MQPITMLTLICAALVLALVALAVYTRRSAENARTNGYDQGYDDAKRDAYDRINELNHDITRLQELAATNRAEHTRALDATMLDCDARIAIYAARALTSEDITTLRIANQQLHHAVETHLKLQATDSARFANTAIHRLGQLIDRLADTVTKGPDQVERVLTMAADVAPNGKSWLVHGPQACGKTRNARAIANALGLPDILDDWTPGMPVPTTKTLVLTNETGPFTPFTRRILSFEQAMSLVASKQEDAA